MRPMVLTRSAAGASDAQTVDYSSPGFGIGFGCVVSAGGTLTYKIQHTFDDVSDPAVTATWFDHAFVIAKTANTDGNYGFPIRAWRINVTAYTNGSVTVTALLGSK